MHRTPQPAGSLVGLFQQGEGGDRGVCAGEVILCRIVGVRAGSLSQYHITEVNVVGNAAGSADAENPVYVILVAGITSGKERKTSAA